MLKITKNIRVSVSPLEYEYIVYNTEKRIQSRLTETPANAKQIAKAFNMQSISIHEACFSGYTLFEYVRLKDLTK